MSGIQYVFTALQALLCLSLTSCATSASAERPQIEHSLASEWQAPFIPHTETKPFGSYLTMNLPFENFAPVRLELEAYLKHSLQHRGEAHITIITPPEFDNVLKDKITIQEINKIAERAKIQEAHLQYRCIGEAKKEIQGHREKAYFIVVIAPALLEIRKEIQKLYISRGGSKKAFNPDLFFPHITLGYTLRDLHYEEGAIKDETSCAFSLKRRKL